MVQTKIDFGMDNKVRKKDTEIVGIFHKQLCEDRDTWDGASGDASSILSSYIIGLLVWHFDWRKVFRTREELAKP